MKKISILITCLLLSVICFAQSKEEKEVERAIETLRKAMVDGDKGALEKIAADDLTYGHSSGVIEDKGAFVEALASGKSNFTRIDLSEQTIKIAGTTAWVRHKLAGELDNAGKTSALNLGVLLVWQKQKGEWKLLARQAYKL